MKTPISYYGGKQMLATKILKLLPEHKLYCEPFVGGGAIFFAKEPSAVEVINDIDGRVVSFFKVCKTDFDALKMLILQTPHSREIHREADYVLKNQYLFSKLKIAWAFWVQTNMSFGCSIGAGFGYGKKKSSSEKKTMNKRNGFTEDYAKRLECVQIEQNDAIRVIESRDTEDTLFYLDPPYYNSDMGHYSFYTENDYIKLLETISGIKGKFLMSSYPSEHLDKFSKKNKWDKINIEMTIPMSSTSKKKIEVLTANYNLN
jgi:DNA adenine methylase